MGGSGGRQDGVMLGHRTERWVEGGFLGRGLLKQRLYRGTTGLSQINNQYSISLSGRITDWGSYCSGGTYRFTSTIERHINPQRLFVRKEAFKSHSFQQWKIYCVLFSIEFFRFQYFKLISPIWVITFNLANKFWNPETSGKLIMLFPSTFTPSQVIPAYVISINMLCTVIAMFVDFKNWYRDKTGRNEGRSNTRCVTQWMSHVRVADCKE